MDIYKPQTHPCTGCKMPLQTEPNLALGAFSVTAGIFRCNRCNSVLAVSLSLPQNPKQNV
ncbi:MAG: hypothetical protein F9K23_05970 [Bacteroidetes bacterium]|nr:MAG: hypothetical protein F9K23_05970 [Bacteroidota bacterium]